ncbi:hypothetical protein [Methanobacterium aggregans]|uniref:hypothetical protein n=1 Tax=Methanobacterium aggregans TaxID=1615586 RepID=UPI001AE4854B|nr:hypothetical protein [Methanobacterium aggregans]MBP2046795.1 hypothetical protein [Methanobacterium aggregans]
MDKIEKIVLIVIMVFLIFLGTFGSFGTSISSINDTNITNTTKLTNTTSKSSSLVTLAAAAPSSSSYTSLTVTPSSVDLGSVLADNSENSYPSQTTIEVCAGDFVSFNRLNLYVKSAGDLDSGTDNIPINNLKYDGFGSSSLQKTSFNTNYNLVTYWNTQSFRYHNTYSNRVYYVASDYDIYGNTIYLSPITTSANYYLTVPFGTSPGTYQTTIEYIAIFDTATQPV